MTVKWTALFKVFDGKFYSGFGKFEVAMNDTRNEELRKMLDHIDSNLKEGRTYRFTVEEVEE